MRRCNPTPGVSWRRRHWRALAAEQRVMMIRTSHSDSQAGSCSRRQIGPADWRAPDRAARVSRRKVTRLSRLAAVAVIVLTSVACGVPRARELATSQAHRTWKHLQAGAYAQVYRDADTIFREQVTEQQWLALCADVDQRLGKRMTSRPKEPVVMSQSGGYLVDVPYDTEFERGRAVEDLLFFVGDGKAALRSYQVDLSAIRR
jgi:hypothetical protein